MKTLVILAVSFLATAVGAEKCVYATVAPELHSLAQPIAKCMTATDNSYNLVRPEVPPTPEQSAAICSKCKDFVEAVFALPPWPDCTLNLGGVDQTLTAYFDKMIGGCKTGGNGAAATTTAPPTAATTGTTTSSGSQDNEAGSASSAPEPVVSNNSSSVATTAPVTSSPKSGATTTALSAVLASSLVLGASIAISV